MQNAECVFAAPFILHYALCILHFLKSFPFGLAHAQVIGLGCCGVGAFAPIHGLDGGQCHAGGPLVGTMLRGQDQLGDVIGQVLVDQSCAVAHQLDGAVDVRKLPAQFLQGNGPVLADAHEPAVLRQEDGVVDLISSCVHAGADMPLHDAQPQGHGL